MERRQSNEPMSRNLEEFEQIQQISSIEIQSSHQPSPFNLKKQKRKPKSMQKSRKGQPKQDIK